MLIQNLRALTAGSGGEQRTSDVEAVIPLAFNFPHAGTMLSFLFVLFAASAFGIDLSLWTDLTLVASGIPVLFGGGTYAMGFLLDQAGVPNDVLPLFYNSESIVTRFRAGVSVVSLIVVSLWVHSSLTGQLRFRPVPMALPIGGTLGAFLAAAALVRPLFSHGDSGIDHRWIERQFGSSPPPRRPLLLELLPGTPTEVGTQSVRPQSAVKADTSD